MRKQVGNLIPEGVSVYNIIQQASLAINSSGVWCLFEFLLSSRQQLELVFTTDVGVVGDDAWQRKSFTRGF